MNSKMKKIIKKNIKENTGNDELSNVSDFRLYDFISPLTFEKSDIKVNKDDIKPKNSDE